jgi:HAD superfamily hydrolase (TIGR01549 family)
MRTFVVFDLGETLIDYHLNGLWYESLKTEVIPLMYKSIVDKSSILKSKAISFNTFQEVAYKCISDKSMYNKPVQLTTRIKEYFKTLGIPQDEELIDIQIESFYETIKNKVELYDDVISNLKKLVKNGYKLGLFSNTPWECPGYLMERIMKKKKIYRYFAIRLFSGDIELRKPDPAVFDILLNKVHELKSNMIYIGDREVDIKTAVNFGIPSIHLNRINHELEKDCPQPTYTIQNLDELINILPNIK